MVNIGEKDYEHGSKEKMSFNINLGTPDAPEKELKIYLNQFLSDPRVIELPKYYGKFY